MDGTEKYIYLKHEGKDIYKIIEETMKMYKIHYSQSEK